MGVEIERKFLVKKDEWQSIRPGNSVHILQGYILNSPEKTVRIRVKGEQGFITIKGATENISRAEFEYEIPLEDAKKLFRDFCPKFIEKYRFTIEHEGFIWEIDEFLSPNKGLILAEVELEDENIQVPLPSWIDKEVSDNPDYFNSNMLT